MWFSAGVITPDIRLAISAGAPLPLALENAIYEQTKLKVHNFLGASECGGIAYDQTDTPRTEENFVGTPMHGVRLSVDDYAALLVQSPALADTYWPPSPDSAGISQLTPDGFRTGDLAQISDDGLRLIGRASDLMNLAGRKVHPTEIEAHLRTHPAVAECIAFSVPSSDPHRHEDMVMGWRTKPGQTVAAQDLARWMADLLPTWKCPRTWCHWPDLSPDSRGKISRHAWKMRYLSESKCS
jgi:acyl-coenzyme A synthetase/AMP-(fatty) acid ligase